MRRDVGMRRLRCQLRRRRLLLWEVGQQGGEAHGEVRLAVLLLRQVDRHTMHHYPLSHAAATAKAAPPIAAIAAAPLTAAQPSAIAAASFTAAQPSAIAAAPLTAAQPAAVAAASFTAAQPAAVAAAASPFSRSTLAHLRTATVAAALPAATAVAAAALATATQATHWPRALLHALRPRQPHRGHPTKPHRAASWRLPAHPSLGPREC